jgi:RES domain-containing protein
VVDQRLVARVDALEPVTVETEAFRHVAEGRHPLSGVGARVHGGRWNPPDSFATLYLALERETAIAEFHRLAARQLRMPEDFLPRRLYRYEVALTAVLDLRQPDARDVVELSDAELQDDDATACRAIGDAAQYSGLEGILAPSATRVGTVLAVFFDRLRADSYLHDLDFERWDTPPRRL